MTVSITKSDPVNVGGFGSRYLIYDDGSVYDNKKDKWVRQRPDRHGNPKVFLRNRYGGMSLHVAYLVAFHFVRQKKPHGLVLTFKDGDRTNTSADNLKWVSRMRGVTTLRRKP